MIVKSKFDGKIMLLLPLVLLPLVLAWVYFRSPAYALWELEKAIDSKDLGLFYKRTDIAALHKSGIDALATKKLADRAKEPGFVEAAQSALGVGLSKISALTSIDLLKHEFELEFQRDRKQITHLDPRLEKTLLRLFLHDVVSFDLKGWVYSEDGAIVTTELRLLKMAKNYPLSFRMRKNSAGDWQVYSFEGLSSLLTAYEQDRIQKLAEHNAKIQRELAEGLTFFGETRSDSQGFGSTISLDVLFQNKLPEPVTFFKGTIRGASAVPKVEALLESSSEIGVGEKKVFLIKKDQFLVAADAGIRNLVLKFHYQEVRLKSGKTYKVLDDFDDISF